MVSIASQFGVGQPKFDMKSGGPIVMVVDDDESVRTSLARLLRSARLPVELYTSAEDFRARVPDDAKGCLILDMELPGERGLELQAHCALHRPELAIVLISAFDDKASKQRALAAGAIAFLKKPFDAECLLGLIRQNINRHA